MSARTRFIRTSSLGIIGLLVAGAVYSGGSAAYAVDGSVGGSIGAIESVDEASSASEVTNDPAADASDPASVANGATEIEAPAAPAPVADAAPVEVAPAPEATVLPESTDVTEPVDAAAVLDVPAPNAADTATLQWGGKTSFRNYITSPIAKGTITTLGATTGTDTFSWTRGSVVEPVGNDATGLEIEFGAADGVHFQGHASGDDFILDLAFTHPKIKVTSSTTAELYLDVDGREFVDTTTVGDYYSLDDVHFADVTLPAYTQSGSTYTWANADATMTADGLEAFGGFYNATTAGLDPITFSADIETPVEGPKGAETKLALSGTQSSKFVGADVALEAKVTPAEALGTVQFTENGIAIGAPVAVQRGSAKYTVKPTKAGNFEYRASFTPTDTNQFLASKSVDPVTVSLTEEVTGTKGTLQWGVKESFRSYITGNIAHGEILASGGAKQANGNGVFTFPQASTEKWNGKTGSVKYAGTVNFTGHGGILNVDVRNPEIIVKNEKSAELRIPFGTNQTLTVATIDLSKATRSALAGGAVKFENAKATLTNDGSSKFFSYEFEPGELTEFYKPGQQLDDMTFIIGADSGAKPSEPTTNPSKPTTPSKNDPATPTAPVATDGAAAGSMNWGVSSYFVGYTTQKSGPSCPTAGKHCAGGSIDQSGVGGDAGSGWSFPQAVSSSWNTAAQTGTVQYSGSVLFKGYGQTMFQVVNPSITVNSASSATLSTGNSTRYGPQSVQLNLASAAKSVGASGEVTWSGVTVEGSMMGISDSQVIGFDNLSFTVGSAAQVSYGSASAGEGAKDKKTYTPAATAPATTGVTVLTDAEKIKPGGRIEIEASGFDKDDEGVLVVLYSDPIVLDDAAQADENGVVRWSGTLPKDVTGTHTITIQGSTNAGAVIDIVEPEKKKKASQSRAQQGTQLETQAVQDRAMSAGFLPTAGGMALWEWWASAGGLVAIAACMTLLAIRQRRSAR
ncbi:HtaA domain-containing protein [Leucobacter japonicus]|uniref:HtaA domain-containing protein n=1 Tax=Leucobacter japonicus TaxID=1461259 RepID=UPI0006A7A272|nr:HtaA domain-containing protein [Leucobacter japonicus]